MPIGRKAPLHWLACDLLAGLSVVVLASPVGAQGGGGTICDDDASERCDFDLGDPWSSGRLRFLAVLLVGGASSSAARRPRVLSLNEVADKMRPCKGWNFDRGDVSGARRGNRLHRGIDIQTYNGTTFRAVKAGRVERGRTQSCGEWVKVHHEDGSYEVYCDLAADSRAQDGDWVPTGGRIGKYGGTGTTNGPHLHLGSVGPDGEWRDPIEHLFGGRSCRGSTGLYLPRP